MTTSLNSLIFKIFFVLFWIFIMRRMNSMNGDKTMGFGKAKVKKADDKKKTTFADVAGADEEAQHALLHRRCGRGENGRNVSNLL